MKKDKKESILNRLLQYSHNYKGLAYLSWLLAAANAVCTLLPFWFIWKIVKEAIAVAPDFQNAISLNTNALYAFLSAIAAIILYILSLLFAHMNAFRVASNIRITLMHHIALLPPGKKDEIGSGALRHIVSDSSEATETYLAHQLPDEAKSTVMCIGVLGMMFFCDWKLALITLIPAVIGFMAIMSMAGKGLREKMTHYQNALSDMSNEAVEYIRGIPVVKVFGQTIFSFKRFKDSIDGYSTWASDYTKEVRFPTLIYTVAINSMFAFFILAAKLFAPAAGQTTFLFHLVFFMLISPLFTSMLTSMMYSNKTKMTVEDALTRMDHILQIQPLENSNSAHPKQYDLSFSDVSFGYTEEKEVLSHISFQAPAGKTLALVGPSGSGKSTIAYLASRFYDAKSGKISIGGLDIRDIPKEELMNTVSFVFQNAKLLKGSILDNIRLGKPNATEEEVLSALQAAQCMDIIEKFPAGIHTVIGADGVYLSGGEQQRLTIARAILKDAPILILDEATAFADPDNESKIQTALETLATKKTVLMVAHRLSTIKHADQILVLKDGSLAEQGSFDQLLNKNGLFSHMWEEYTKSVEWSL